VFILKTHNFMYVCEGLLNKFTYASYVSSDCVSCIS